MNLQSGQGRMPEFTGDGRVGCHQWIHQSKVVSPGGRPLAPAGAAVDLSPQSFGPLGVILGTILLTPGRARVPQSLIVGPILRNILAEDQAHPIRNGLVSRSSPIVVKGPCPGTTTVSSGSASTGQCSERMIFS